MFQIKPMPAALPEALVARAHAVEPATLGHLRWTGFPDSAITSLANPARIAGTLVSLALPGFDSTLLHHAVGMLRPGDVLVIDRLGDRSYACVGGGVVKALACAKVAGVIVDGPCADPMEIRASGLPVWGRGFTAVTTRTHGIAGCMNVPVSIGGAVGMPGDLVIADAGGIVFVPMAEAEAAVEQAIRFQQDEAALFPLIGGDMPLGRLTGASEKVEKRLTL